MRLRQWRLWSIGTIAVLAVTSGIVRASDPVGVYARIDRVVMEPNDRAPERIQIWGVFSIADARSRDDYQPAHDGYLYFALPEGAPAARLEWHDLQAVAGTQQIVAFGSRYQHVPRLRAANETPQSPDRYPINIGLLRINGRTDYAPVHALVTFKP